MNSLNLKVEQHEKAPTLKFREAGRGESPRNAQGGLYARGLRGIGPSKNRCQGALTTALLKSIATTVLATELKNPMKEDAPANRR